MSNHAPFSIHTLELGPMENFIYLIQDHASNQIAVVDPGWESDKIVAFAQNLGCTITDVLLTHSHFDHVSGLNALLDATKAQVHLLKEEAQFWNEHLEIATLHYDGEVIYLGETPIEILHTPGHTPGSVCYLIAGHLFTGDTLFVLGCGRCDLPGGDPNEMYRSLYRLGTTLPGETTIHPGHNYGGKPTSTMAEQLVCNPSMNFLVH